MSDFLKIVEANGDEHIINKRFIISAEKNSKGFILLTVGFEQTDNPYIRIYALEGPLERVLKIIEG